MRFDKKEGMPKDGGSHYFNLDLETSSKLKQFARANRATPFLVLSAIWALLSSRYSGQKDIIIHYPINARPPKFRGLLGGFVNTVLMKIDVDQKKTVSEFVKSVVQQRKDTKAYQRASLSDIVQSLRSNGIYEEGSFNVSIASTNLGLTELNLNNCSCRSIPRELQHLDDLELHFEVKEQIGIMIDHNGVIFDEKSILRLSQNFKKILDQFILFPNKLLKDLRLLTDERRKQILVDWNDTKAPYPKDKTIHQLFEEQVKQTPDNIAVVFEDEKLSYKDLNKKSNQLARLIRAKYKKQNKKDLKPDSLIGLCVERSLDMIIGILGILKAGAAYVPLDPDYPQDRLEYMIEDSHEGLIITQKDIVAKDRFLDKLHHDELLVIDSDEVKAELSKQSDSNLDKVGGPDNLAYVIYTSGSTGKPKGVMLEHDGVINRINWMHKEYGLNKNDKILQKTPFSFDVSVWELLWAITYGGQLVFAKPEGHKDPEYLLESIEKFGITKMHFVPSMLQVFMDYIEAGNLSLSKLSSLKDIFCSGEALPLPLAKMVLDKLSLKLNNLYGPTEASIDVSFYDCVGLAKSDLASVPIGRAIDNTRLYILDNNLNLCPTGAPGELYIGGAGLARGYLNQDKLTKERFILNPFAKELGLSKSDRIYKTGDLVRWLPDGNIEYLGRTDFQVKIRGFRIELGEIENVLSKHKSISQVSVIDKEKEGSKYLVAYYVITKDKKAPEIDDLRDHLSESLPDYMVPAAFVKLDEIPLTPNGKINRRALPEPDMSLMGEEYIAPRNEIEEKLAEIWSDVLKIDQAKVGIHDNFFNLGGHSLLTIQLISRINKTFNLSVLVSWVFKNLTIAEQAASIEKDEESLKVYQPILNLRELKGNVPLFLVHPGNGGAESYRDLSVLFKNANKLISGVYGIESYNLNHLDKPISNMKLLAAKYIEYMKIIQPKGPYFIGGWSLGGSVAYEIAHHLKDQGEAVLGIYLIDTMGVEPDIWKKAQGLFSNDDFIIILKEMGLTDEDIEQLLKLKPIEDKLISTYSLSELEDIEVFLMNALNRERWQDKKVDKAKKKAHELINQPNNGWDKYAKNLIVHEFDADHMSIMKDKKHLKRLVKLIEDDMNAKIKAWLAAKK